MSLSSYYEHSGIIIYRGDCREVLPQLGQRVEACITDPPYGLGFMGKDWDHGVPGIEFWRLVLAALLPGASLLAFGGTRTSHRLACAIEDAGFEIRDTLMWLYGSGFPKSHDISKAMDKAAGARREREPCPRAGSNKRGVTYAQDAWTAANFTSRLVDEPITAHASGWRGYGTALKPAWEMILYAMKPCEGTFAANAAQYGVAGLWIDGGRVEHVTVPGGQATNLHLRANIRVGDDSADNALFPRRSGDNLVPTHALGRWPANLLLSHTDECEQVGVRRVSGNPQGDKSNAGRLRQSGFAMAAGVPDYADVDGKETVPDWRCSPDCPVRLLDEQSGASRSPQTYRRNHDSGNVHAYGAGIGEPAGTESLNYGDRGGASRFFQTFPPTRFRYCSKASRRERDAGLEDMPGQTMRTYEGGPIVSGDHPGVGDGGHVQSARNSHPTVKPLAIMRYLCTLTRTPTGGTVLDPFMGSGTTGLACLETERPFIGIEQDEHSCEIAAKRIDAALNRASETAPLLEERR